MKLSWYNQNEGFVDYFCDSFGLANSHQHPWRIDEPAHKHDSSVYAAVAQRGDPVQAVEHGATTKERLDAKAKGNGDTKRDQH